MPWTCPSCHRSIQHETDEDAPRLGIVYRCHICRLDLVLDPKRRNLIALGGDDPGRAGATPK